MNIKYISLGPNCQTAGSIKRLGYKTESYPFDWIISNIDIVIDCINTDFQYFLDKNYYLYNKNTKHIIHSKYNKEMFIHRNPLYNPDDYEYIQRCVNRFLDLYKSDDVIYFIYTTYANDPNVILIDEFLKLLNLLRSKIIKSHLIVYNYVQSNEKGYKIEKIEDIYCVTINLVYNKSIEYDVDRAMSEFYKENNILLEISVA